MSTEKRGASFNPDEASGGFDKGRVVITKAAVDYFTATKGKNAGQRYVSLNMVFNRTDDGTDMPVNLIIGSADEWSPNSTKTEAIPTREDGKFWNKSDIYRFMVSLVNAGFPKARMGSDISAIVVGLDVDVARTETGGTHKDAEGKERPNTALLVTKIHTSKADLESGAYSKNVKAGASKPSTSSKPNTAVKPAASSAPAPASEDVSDYARTLLVEILEAKGGAASLGDVEKDAYIRITKAKRGAQRQAIIDLLRDDTFVAGLDGLVTKDGDNLAIAA